MRKNFRGKKTTFPPMRPPAPATPSATPLRALADRVEQIRALVNDKQGNGIGIREGTVRDMFRFLKQSQGEGAARDFVCAEFGPDLLRWYDALPASNDRLDDYIEGRA